MTEVWHYRKQINTIFFIDWIYGGGEHTALPPTNFVPHSSLTELLLWLHVHPFAILSSFVIQSKMPGKSDLTIFRSGDCCAVVGEVPVLTFAVTCSFP